MAEASVEWGKHLQFPSRKAWSSYLKSIVFCSLGHSKNFIIKRN